MVMRGKILFILTVITTSLFSSCDSSVSNNAQVVPQDSTFTDSLALPPVVKDDSLFGVKFDSTLQTHIMEVFPKNKTLSDILTHYGISNATVNQLACRSKEIFDVRKFRQGNRFHVLQTKDSLPITTHFIYEVNQADYVVYAFLEDSVAVSMGHKDLQRKERLVTGTIETSLWNAVVGQGIPFALALELSNIYAWNIDFFGLQKGDQFTVKYDEIWCDSTFVKVDTIYAARFHHCGADFYAFPFTQHGRSDYFDYDGNSLRKAFLKAPLSYSRISSTFSNSRFHPVLKIFRPHHGVDYAAPYGTPVSSIGDGRVIYKGYSGGGGNTVKVQHNSTYMTCYMHLSKFGKFGTGSVVKQGDVIGYVGSTGTSTGPHLDFRVYENGHPINPLKLKSPPVEPVDSIYRDQYFFRRDSLMKILNQ